MHHYPFHPGDYLKDTAHWSEDRVLVEVEAGLLRDLAYRRLLDLYYGEEEPIPAKTRLVAIRIRMLKHEEIVTSVLREKFVLIDGYWRQKRVDDEVARYQHRVEVARANGRKGGRPRVDTKPTGNPMGTKSATNQEPRTKKNTPLPPEGVERFDTFWSRYPRKDNKPKALAAFRSAMGYGGKPARCTFEELMAGLTVHLGCEQWIKDRGTFVPYASSWLNADGWNNRPAQHEAGSGGKDGADKGWWETRQGLMDRAVGLGVPPPAEDTPQAFLRFKAHVWLRAGDGPWWDAKDTAYALAVRLRDEGGTTT